MSDVTAGDPAAGAAGAPAPAPGPAARGEPAGAAPGNMQAWAAAGDTGWEVFFARRVSHAYLLAGPPGAGHQEAARAAAAALLCPHGAAGRACGRCDSCLQVAGGVHPDLVAPDQHGIDAVRQVLATLAYRPRVAARKVVLWRDVDRLTPQAANALLKSVEEPPPFVTFLMTTDHPERVLPTLRSRCQRIPFRPRPREERARQLAAATGSEPLVAYWALRVAADDGEQAARLLAEPACGEEVAQLRDAARRLREGGALDALEAARQLAQWGERAEPAAEVLVFLLRGDDATLGAGGDGAEAGRGDPVAGGHPGPGVGAEEPGGAPPAARLAWTRALAELRRALQANANRQLALEVFCWRCWRAARDAGAEPVPPGPGAGRGGRRRGWR